MGTPKSRDQDLHKFCALYVSQLNRVRLDLHYSWSTPRQIDASISRIAEPDLHELEKTLFATSDWLSARKLLNLIISASMAGEHWQESWSFTKLADEPPKLQLHEGESEQGPYDSDDEHEVMDEN